MILIVAFVAVLAASIVVAVKVDPCRGLHLFAGISLISSVLGLLLCLLTLFINRAGQNESLVRIEAFRQTLSDARSRNLSEFERAAILKQVADWNEWIAAEKYWNAGFWDVFHIDEVMNLEPLR